MPELVLTHGAGCVNLVAENDKWNLRELFNRKESIELRFRLGKSLAIGGVDEKDDTIDLGEVITPEAASCTSVEGSSQYSQR